MARQILMGSSEHRTYRWVAWGLFTLAVILFGFAYSDVGQVTILDNDYNISLFRVNKAIAFMIAILGLQVVIGFTGQIALGQSFFVGLGAYTTAWLVADKDWGYLTTLAVVVPLCFVAGMILGLPALRIKGLYLALVTLAVAAIFPSLVRLDQLADITNGSNGKVINNSELHPPSWLPIDGVAGALQGIPWLGQYFGDGDLSERQAEGLYKYFLFVIVAAVCFWLVANLVKSRPGRAMRAIRDNETGAAVSGVDLAMTKTLAFGVASALGGVAGVVYVMEIGIASPDDFTQIMAINFIVGLVIGGVGTLTGAVVGGFVITLIPDWASSTTSVGALPERWLQGPTGTFILGVVLIIITFFLPGGVVAGVRKLRDRIVSVVPPRLPPGGPPSASERPTLPDDEPAHAGAVSQREPATQPAPGG